MLDVDADRPTLGIEIDHHAVGDLLGIGAGSAVEVDVERIGFGLVVKFQAPPFCL